MPTTDDKAFLKQLLEVFNGEAREHIVAIAQKLSELARAGVPERPALVEVAFREAHSLKAAARAVNLTDIESICQAVEGVFAAFKRGEAEPSGEMLNALHAANDAMADLLAGGDAAARVSVRARTDAVLGLLHPAQGDLQNPVQGVQTQSTAAAPEVKRAQAGVAQLAPAADTIRLPVQRLDALLLQTENLLTVKLGAQRQAGAQQALHAAFGEWQQEWGRVRGSHASQRSDGQMQSMLAFLEWSERWIAAMHGSIHDLAKAATAEARAAGANIDRLQQDIKQILMLDSHSLIEGVAKTVRDLARDQGKDLEFVAEGGDLQMDRRILEELREPLLHLLRNAVDHGVEKPELRIKAGKPARAMLRLKLIPKDSDKVEFVVSDDGAGVPLAKLAAAAVKAGLLPAQRATVLDAAELLPLLFQSGISTSPIITEVSGRGLGMAIVRERVERLGGSIAVETHEGRGTTFRLLVPLSLTTFRGIQVRVSDQIYVIPTLGVVRVLRARRDTLRTIENRPTLAVDGHHVPLVRLAEVLELPDATAAAGRADIVAVVLSAAAQRAGFEVDAVLGDQEVLVKPLGRCLERVRNVAAGTVLGDGRIAAILNVHDLLKSARRVGRKVLRTGVHSEASPTKRELRVLVVEDSITARGLMKNILEAAGYRVKTAVDGVEGWAALKLEPFDLVVSDIEMPRMNGFDLTARIRSDKQLAELPVVLVTALQSREDREHGVDVGANAYISKGDFDQQRLLDVLRRLA